ncbi:MAG: ankyrin repeat domain-containing protein [Rhodospirillales bacterium]|nr:ankyrin repeat domain-containing protein [Rhodospirillales bacterium]
MVKRLSSSLERTVPGRSAWLAVALLSAALAIPAAAQPTPRSPAKTAPPPQAGAPTEIKLSAATRRLFKAVELNDITNVKSNIEADADLFAVNDEGMTAADLAVDKGHFIIAHYLLSRRMLGRTPPLALVPATPAVSDSKPDTRRKRRFASPPLKPAAPKVAEAPPPPPAPETGAREKPKAEAPKAEVPPMRLTVSPAGKPVAGKKPPTPEQTVAEVAEVAEVDEAVEPPAPTQQTDKDGVSEAPTPDKPLADQSVLGFFQSLVDLATPGGEKPPKLVKPAEDSGQEEPVEAVAEAAAGDAPMEPLPPEGDAGDPFKETIVESIVESSDEIIVEVTDETGPDDPLEVVEEITEDVPLSLDEDEQATVTAEPQAEDAPIKEEEEKGFLDRMASLFTSDDNAATGTETGKPAAGDD